MKATDQKIKSTAKQMLRFASVWNNTRTYPASYDMERELGIKQSQFSKKVSLYREFRKQHPEFNLPTLAPRKIKSGFATYLPPELLEQIDEFRIDTKMLRKAKGIVVTSAQFGAPLNLWFWNSLKQYAEYRYFEIVILPIKYGPIKTKDDRLTSTFPDELKGHILFEDHILCKGELTLSTMRMRPTLDRFLTDKVCSVGGFSSTVFAAPKLELEHRPRVGRKYPKAIMTTGAVTHPDYHIDNLGQQDRTGEIATKEHTYAALVFELSGKTFHFRQLHANKRGHFYDIDPLRGGALLVTSTGIEHRPHDISTLICGDWHTGKTDETVRKVTFSGKKSFVKMLCPDHICLHDFVDCDSVSHWEQDQAVRRAFKAPLGRDSLKKELDEGVAELVFIHQHTDAVIHIIPSNHNEYVKEYIEKLKWRNDDINLAFGSKLFNAMVEDLESRSPRKCDVRPIDPVSWYFTKQVPFPIKTHSRQDALVLPKNGKGGILCSLHGDKPPGGGITRSTKTFLKMNQRITLGHNHSSTILGNIWRVGVSTPLMQHYVDNPTTNWTNTHQVIFANGQRQNINIINGKWHGYRLD